MSRKYLGLGVLAALLVQTGCATFGQNRTARTDAGGAYETASVAGSRAQQDENETIWDLFKPREDPGKVGAVNKYIWNASLEVLDFCRSNPWIRSQG